MLKTVTLIQFSTFVSIAVSVCILVNLFVPGLSTVITDKSVVLQPGSHTCKCNPEPHSLSTCCCAKENDTCEVISLPKDDSQGIFSSFIQSLGCTSLPDQLTSFSYNVTMPEDDITVPGLSMLHCMYNHQEVFPESIKSSPLYKPPRHIA